jgi:hypothetical protein
MAAGNGAGGAAFAAELKAITSPITMRDLPKERIATLYSVVLENMDIPPKRASAASDFRGFLYWRKRSWRGELASKANSYKY